MSEKTYKREQVVQILGSVIQQVANPKQPVDDGLMSEVEKLKQAIDHLRDDLNFAHPDHIQSHIPNATDELDAVVAMTESATHSIIESCEEIQKLVQSENLNADINRHITQIIEVCTFQDITGQRISKIIKALKEIDRRAAELKEILSTRFGSLESKLDASKQPEVDPLLNGPALPQNAITQAEIDKLLSDFE